MSRPVSSTMRRAVLAGGVLVGLAVPSAAFAADPASTAIVLTTDNRISTFETAYPGEAATPTAVTGLTAGDRLVAIDVRPQNGGLYALGRNAAAGTIQLYALSTRTAVATPVGAPLTQGGTAADTQFGFDFNPKVDRIRVVSDAGLNLRLNPNDGSLAADTALSGGTTKLDGAAYTNDVQNAAFTTLYGLSAADDKLYRSTNPNGGTTAPGKAVTSALGPVDFGAVGGFDIAPGNDVDADNAEASAGKVGYAAVKVGTANLLAKIDLNTAVATPLGTIGNGATDVQGLAIQQEAAAGGLPAILTSGADGKTLRRFDTAATALPDTPAAGTSVAVTGVDAAETLVGIDWRPSTGQLFGLGVNGALNTATLYRIDPQTGAAANVGAVGGIAYVNNDGSPADLPDPATVGYDVDFNPTVDRLRVVTANGLNFRINPSTGAAVDGDDGGATALTGTQFDGAQNAASADIGTDVSGTAYTNAFAPAPTGAVTTQYGISAGKDQLLIQNPPNAGTQTAPKALKVGAAALNVTSVRGFDIPASVAGTTANAPATGSGLAVLGTGTAASTGLYAIDLATGAATLRTTIAGTTSLAVGDGPPATKARTVVPPIVVPPVTGGSGGGGTTTLTTPATPAKATFGSATRVTVKLRSTKAKRNGPAKVTLRNTNRFAVRVRLQATTPKSGKRKAIKYATTTYTVKASSSRTVNLRLPSAARKVLASKRKLTIKVTLRVTDPAGKSRTVRKTLTLRLKR